MPFDMSGCEPERTLVCFLSANGCSPDSRVRRILRRDVKTMGPTCPLGMSVRAEPDCLNCVDLEGRSQFQASFSRASFDTKGAISCRTGLLPRTNTLVVA